MQEFIPNIEKLADGKERISVISEFSEQEMQEMKNNLMMNSIEVSRLNEKIKEVQKEKRKFTDENKDLVKSCRAGQTDSEQECYFQDDVEDGVRRFYNESGHFVQERRLLPSERKSKLQFVKQA